MMELQAFCEESKRSRPRELVYPSHEIRVRLDPGEDRRVVRMEAEKKNGGRENSPQNARKQVRASGERGLHSGVRWHAAVFDISSRFHKAERNVRELGTVRACYAQCSKS